MTTSHKCGPGYGTRGERAYNLRCEGKSWKEIADIIGMPSATPETDVESAAHNAARKYALAKTRGLPWPIILTKPVEEELPPEPSPLEHRRREERNRQRLAYEARVGGGGWAWVAEVTLYSCIPHAVAGARRYAAREGLPWPIPKL